MNQLRALAKLPDINLMDRATFEKNLRTGGSRRLIELRAGNLNRSTRSGAHSS